MYIPPDDFARISSIIATIYKGNPVHCSSKKGYCYFSEPCIAIKDKDKNIKIELFDDFSKYVIEMSNAQTFIPGG